MPERRYYDGYTSLAEYSLSELENADPEIQIGAMRTWFYSNYEDPAENTPYETREGGYIYIWGGPYDADFVLQEEFADVISYGVIKKLVNELNNHCWEWAPIPRDDDYYDYSRIEDIAGISTYHENFSEAIKSVKALLYIEVSEKAEECLCRLLFANVITALETYLSDAFINTVIPSDSLRRKFVENLPEFEKEKISLSEVYKALESVEVKVNTFLSNLVWHNLGRVRPLYENVLNINFPRDFSGIAVAISVRHDLVHRNGKTRDGEDIVIARESVERLIADVETFVGHLDDQLGAVRQVKKGNAESDEEGARELSSGIS